MSSLARFSRALAVIVMGACVSPPPMVIDDCTRNEDCLGGEVCREGECRELCYFARHCSGNSECADGMCVEAVCGNGVQGSQEECDVSHSACVDCKLIEGFSCNETTCSESTYRAALSEESNGWVDVIDMSTEGTASVIRSYSNGFNPESPWPEWSADGTQLAYPGGPPSNAMSVYLYDVPGGSTDFYTYFAGDQPDFAADRLELLARTGSTLISYTSAGGAVDLTIAGFSLAWPKWDPGMPTRFAYLDRPSGSASGALSIYDGTSTLPVAASGVYGFAWQAGGGGIYYVRTNGASCALHHATLDTTTVTNTAIRVSNVPCAASAVANGANTHVAIATPGATTFFLIDLAQAPIDLDTLTAHGQVVGGIRDLAWTPDDAHVAVLFEANAAQELAGLSLFDVAGSAPVAIGITGAYQRIRFSPDLLQGP